jgi:hypothetical protein
MVVERHLQRAAEDETEETLRLPLLHHHLVVGQLHIEQRLRQELQFVGVEYTQGTWACACNGSGNGNGNGGGNNDDGDDGGDDDGNGDGVDMQRTSLARQLCQRLQRLSVLEVALKCPFKDGVFAQFVFKLSERQRRSPHPLKLQAGKIVWRMEGMR